MKLIKFKLVVVAVLIVAACIFPALRIDEWMGGDPKPETSATALASQLDSGYLIEQDLATQRQVFWRYYTYDAMIDDAFIMHTSELRFLPEFAVGEQPYWEDTSRYLCDFAAYTVNSEGALCWAYDDFAAVRDVLLPGVEVRREDSGWLNYLAESDGFVSVGWDYSGTVYYLLEEPLSRDEDGIFTAHLAGFPVGEMWMEDGEYAEDNDAVMYRRWKESGLDFREFCDDVLPGMLAAWELERGEDITVTFRLSGDDELPLAYLSCERAILYK